MSLFQHCDVEDCDSAAEVSMTSIGNPLPDGWFVLMGMQRYMREPRVLESTVEFAGNEVAVKMPQLPEEAVEHVNVVICDRHKLPWKVRARRRDL